MAPGRYCVACAQLVKICRRTGYCAAVIGLRVVKTTTAVGGRPAALTKIHRPKALARAPHRKQHGQSWESAHAAISIGPVFSEDYVICFARKTRMARGMKSRLQARVSQACFI